MLATDAQYCESVYGLNALPLDSRPVPVLEYVYAESKEEEIIMIEGSWYEVKLDLTAEGVGRSLGAQHCAKSTCQALSLSRDCPAYGRVADNLLMHLNVVMHLCLFCSDVPSNAVPFMTWQMP